MSLSSTIARAGFWAWQKLPGFMQELLIQGERPKFPRTALTRETRRLLILPTNSAGQGTTWAEAVRASSNEHDAVNVMLRLPTSFDYQADFSVTRAVAYGSKKWQRSFFTEVRQSVSHVLIESGSTLTGPPELRRAISEVEAHVSGGATVGFLFHGSDIRDVDRHAAAEADSPYRDTDAPHTATLRSVVRRNRALLRRFPDAPVYVSTPDLLLDLPEATFLPVIAEAAFFEGHVAPITRVQPVVLHVPSSSITKGTDLIHDQMQRLHQEGVIEYRERSGLSRDELRAEYRDADLILDQFRLGSYGVAAVEAMAMGKIVVGHVSGNVREAVRERTNMDLPILESSASNLEMTLRDVLRHGHRASLKQRAESGVRFATELHSGPTSAEALGGFLESSRKYGA